MNRERWHARLWISLAVLCVLAGGTLAARPVRADWPPRPDPTPTPASHGTTGGAIWLHVAGAAREPPLYAVVQWQDGLGGWHDVEGWRGEIEKQDVIWYVDQKDLGTGPFRWVMYRGDKDVLGSSESFYLPSVSGQIVRVLVTLE